MMDQFRRVKFTRFKAFKSFRIDLTHFNILVGPNNSGKSTILAAFRILAAAMRRATSKNPTILSGPHGQVMGWNVDLQAISVAEENIFYNYDDSEPAEVVFRLSNGNSLTLFFPERHTCVLIPDARDKPVVNTKGFRAHFNCPIGFVPILGPVEHREPLFEREAARLALFNYRAARNFRNIWHHYPEQFEEFRTVLQQTWPGMDIERPEIDRSHDRPLLFMYCPEQRIPRELFWAGFGFQVWCQMLTHLVQSKSMSLFLIDEPDIYLHSELQRQLLGLLRNLGPDILLATHSTEIVTEAETNDIILINKGRKSARRIKDASQLRDVFSVLGSNLNPILTQLAKTRRALFVEGEDFQILGKFARKLGAAGVALRRDFAVVPVEGFNPQRIRNLKAGMETTLGGKIVAAALLDRDYRCDGECEAIVRECEDFCDYVTILRCKEIENFLLVPSAIDRAMSRKITDRAGRLGKVEVCEPEIAGVLEKFSESQKNYVTSQFLANRRRYERSNSPQLHEAQVNEMALNEFEGNWRDLVARLKLLPGKEAISAINKHAQEQYGVNITTTAIIDAMLTSEIPAEMVELVQSLVTFSQTAPGA